ncbi:hypothetical protein LTR97_007426 [Elasticomyces elasticus]|uniref:SET domain-containing protein n=1 Tax=Elasticomyces elasticus TaxID=574655 RepID=A0AAN7W4X6_9PEZI|nr:hypothetical protein LTR97_007426 [Elasticomyces elasticus]
MAIIYEIKDAPGKGRGVFAAQDIKSGTVIMEDRKMMEIKKEPSQLVTERDVQQAFKALSKRQQEQFMQLHQGDRPYPSKVMRIFVANNTKSGNNSFIPLNTAMLNHSCLPNAEMPDSEEGVLYAVRPIAKGEEICQSYYSSPWCATKRQRVSVLQAYYSFQCTCEACTRGPAETAISDARRQLLEILSTMKKGFEPTRVSWMDKLNAANAETPQMIMALTAKRNLQRPLTLHQQTAYSFLMAKFCQAEGSYGINLAKFYLDAAVHLATQVSATMGEYGNLIVISSARILHAWMQAAVVTAKMVRGAEGMHNNGVRLQWESIINTGLESVLGLLERAGVMSSKAFSIMLESGAPGQSGTIWVVDERECRRLLRGEVSLSMVAKVNYKEYLPCFLTNQVKRTLTSK